MDQDLVDLCVEFVEKHPIDGRLDAQEFFESVGEVDLIEFFERMYGLFQP